MNAPPLSACMSMPDTSSDVQLSQPSDISDTLANWKIFGDLGRPSQESPQVTFLPRHTAERLRDSNSKHVSELLDLHTALHRSVVREHKYKCLQARLAAARARVAESFAALEHRTSTIQMLSEVNPKKLQRLQGVTRDLGVQCEAATARVCDQLAAIHTIPTALRSLWLRRCSKVPKAFSQPA